MGTKQRAKPCTHPAWYKDDNGAMRCVECRMVCPHAGYNIVKGELVCATCGAPSPTSKLVNGVFVRIGPKPINCPRCGWTVVHGVPAEEPGGDQAPVNTTTHAEDKEASGEAPGEAQGKAAKAHEDKNLKAHEDKASG